MKGVPDLLYLKRSACPRQIPPTKMWLAKCQVQEHPFAFSQNPTCAGAGGPDNYQMLQRAKEMVTTEPENFVHLFCAVIYDLLRRILWADEEALARDVEERWTPPRHRPWLSSWHPSYLFEYACVSLNGPLFETRKGLPLSITISKVPSSNVRSRMSITSPGAVARSDFV